MATMREVAHRAGVSAKTVSRVFNDDDGVSEVTRRRVKAALRELDYAPNLLAKTFRAGKDDAIAVAVPDAADPFFAALVTGVTAVAARQGAMVLVTSFGAQAAGERTALQVLLNRQVAGVITAPVSSEQGYLRAWTARTPVVFVDREPQGVQADYFVDDDAAGARRAVRHLLDHGHRSIGFVGDDLGLATTRNRWEGYRTELAAAAIDIDPQACWLDRPSTTPAASAAARAGITTWLAGLRQPVSALFSSNARSTIDLVKALHPGQHSALALVSFGDFPLASALQPALTVIDQDPQRLGALAAERLFARIQHPHQAFQARNVLPLRLIERGSGEIRAPEPAPLVRH